MTHFVRRAALLLATALVAPTLHVAFGPEAVAGDDSKKKDKGEKPKKDEEQIKREAALIAIANDFGAKNSAALLARVPKDQKLTLDLDGKEDGYSVTQARGVLDTYFDGIQRCPVTTTDSKDKPVKFDKTDGSFPIAILRKGADKSKTGTLYVTIGDADGNGAYPLRKLRVIEK